MKRLMAILISVAAFISCSSFTNIKINSDFEVRNEIFLNEQSGNFKSLKWVNNGVSDDQTNKLFEKYDVSYESAKVSDYIYIQEELIPFEEVIPLSYFDNLNYDADALTNNEDEYVHNKGYIRFIVKAYDYGYYDGHVVYKIEVTTKQEKSFFINHNDVVIIQHGNNAITLDENIKKAKCTRTVPFDLIPNGKNNTYKKVETINIEPNYSCANGGIYYEFKAQDVVNFYPNSYVKSYNTTINSEYYLVATDTTSIQPTYVHNFNPLEMSLSVNFGPIGVGINIPTWNNDQMVGREMSLPGYNDRISTKVTNLNKTDFGFEQQYFFYEKSKNLELEDLSIVTNRLRCGYIEEEYIVLSPNRTNAGDAYLSLSFSKNIYEIDTRISLWSSQENISKNNGDSAYIQYKNEEGIWVNLVDLLGVDLPTDRKNPKEFTLIIPEGTKEVRFISNVNNPTGDRNKGRICIDDLKLVSYDFN